jgi:hypothetical protein
MPEETVLIESLAVRRDANGWWSHPEYLSEFDDEITEEQFSDWCNRHQVETKITYMESDVPVDVFDTYMTVRLMARRGRFSTPSNLVGSSFRFTTPRMALFASGAGG